jgi:hypothetical protein
MVVGILAGCAGNGSSGGIKTGQGVSDLGNGVREINLGVLSPLSGVVGQLIGIPLTRGIEVYFKFVNDNGGICSSDGKTCFKVNLLERDNKYPDTATQVQQYNDIHNNVLMIAESLGTPTTFAINDEAKQDHMLVSAATLASSLAREQYLVLVGTPYRLQVENAFDYVVNKLNKTAPKTGIIYQNDEYGQDGLQGYTESVSAYHLTDEGQQSFTPGGASPAAYASQVLALQAKGADYVFLTATPGDALNIMLAAAGVNYFPQWILQSPAFASALLATAARPLLERAWLVAQGATWGDTSKPGMAEMLQNVTKYQPDQQPDGYFEFGYTEAKITGAILKKAAANNDLTRDGLYNAFTTLGDVDLGGLYPATHYGASTNDRVPTRDSVIYQIDHTSPGGVKPLTDDFTGTAAKASQF